MTFEVKKDWVTESGLRAVVLFVRGSHHCGYVEVPKGHPLHGLDYSQEHPILRARVDEHMQENSQISPINILCAAVVDGEVEATPVMAFNVHGGITYAGGTGEYPGDGDGWWFGYDCAHAGDAQKGEFAFSHPGDVFRDEEFCVDQCESLARQIASVT